jgi:hypothetical protein
MLAILLQVFLGHNGVHDVEGNELPRLVYVSREKRPGFDHHKKAGAMNSLVKLSHKQTFLAFYHSLPTLTFCVCLLMKVRVSAIISNAPYMLNVDCDHYINNSKALREAMCFMMDPTSGKKICYVQFPQRFDGIDRHDRYSNRNVVFFDVSESRLNDVGLIHTWAFFFSISSSIFLNADQYERIGWHTRTYICWYWMCLQEASTLWVRCPYQEEAPREDMQLLAKMVLLLLPI